MNLGKKLFELRKSKHLSQEQVAEKLHVTRQTVSNWELGETTPDLNQAKELAKFYSISLDDLVGLDTKNILTEKVSNVEKLAGIILTILKVIGVLFIIYIVFIIIAVICFSKVKTETSISGTITCELNNQPYEITLKDNQEFICQNCDTQLQAELKNFIDWNNLNQSLDSIAEYFNQNGGSCQ